MELGMNYWTVEGVPEMLKNKPYLVELLTPKQSDESFEEHLELFSQRYRRILEAGAVVSIPDNPLGNLHFTAMEVVGYLSLPFDPECTLLHINSFHRKKDLDAFLGDAADLGLRHLLVVSGDGGPRLSKLEPGDIVLEGKVVTSVELLRYVEREFPGSFTCGVAFNHYEPREHEMEKLRRKLDAGARFVVTQPVVRFDPAVSALGSLGLPVWVGAWLSKRIDLLMTCVGSPTKADQQPYDPYANLSALRAGYPEFGIYLSQISFKQDWGPLLSRKEAAGKVA
jgi:methylenetetrahydrofolate reductase (NADPH)